jgi:hypothetical protein
MSHETAARRRWGSLGAQQRAVVNLQDDLDRSRARAGMREEVDGVVFEVE